jgi:hypothetical protein
MFGRNTFGQVAAILELDTSVEFLVCPLTVVSEDEYVRKIPYPLMRYQYDPEDRTRFAIENVLCAEVVGPCFVVPAVDRVDVNINDVGIHHRVQADMSLFYVLSPIISPCVPLSQYEEYLSLNNFRVPWNKRKSSKTLLNYNFYLSEDDMKEIHESNNVDA